MRSVSIEESFFQDSETSASEFLENLIGSRLGHKQMTV